MLCFIMTENTIKKPNGPSMVRFISDLGPALAFFLGYMFANKTNQENPVLFATMIFLPVSVLGFIYSWVKEKSVSPIGIFSFVLILIMSALGLWLKNDIFIKMRPTLVYSLMGTILLGSVIFKRNVLKTIFNGTINMPELQWNILARNAGIMNIALAILNEIMWRNFPEKTWVTYNMWGDFSINMAFWIISMIFLSKHLTDENGKPLLEADENVQN